MKTGYSEGELQRLIVFHSVLMMTSFEKMMGFERKTEGKTKKEEQLVYQTSQIALTRESSSDPTLGDECIMHTILKICWSILHYRMTNM